MNVKDERIKEEKKKCEDFTFSSSSIAHVYLYSMRVKCCIEIFSVYTTTTTTDAAACASKNFVFDA